MCFKSGVSGRRGDSVTGRARPKMTSTTTSPSVEVTLKTSLCMRSPGLTSSTDSPRTLPSSRCGFSSVNDLNWEFKKKKRVKVRTVLFQSSIPGLPGVYSALNPFSSVRMPGYNQLAANPLLQQQYAAAPGLGNYYPPRWLAGVVSVTWTCRKTRARDATWLSLSNSFHPVSN